MNTPLTRDEETDARDWVIFVVQSVKERPSQVRYQRLVALTNEFNVIVVSNSPLPPTIAGLVRKLVIVKNFLEVWSATFKVARSLKGEGQHFYVHTQYSPVQAVAGFICKREFRCSWIYDLWDHPSLVYRSYKGPARWLRQCVEVAVRRCVLDEADAWIIAMHPAILGYMPPAPVSCRLIFTKPGTYNPQPERIALSCEIIQRDSSLVVVYAGPMVEHRVNQILKWVECYSGPLVSLCLIGGLHGDSSGAVAEIEYRCEQNTSIAFNYCGELPLGETLEILRRSDIGLCPLDTFVLNYRFAFPIKVIEQMSMGLIVVANATHGVCNYIRDGVNGILINHELGGICEAMDRAITIATNTETKAKVGEAARETVKNDTWQTMNERLIRQIKEVLTVC